MRLNALFLSLLLLTIRSLSAQTVADFKTKELLVFDFKEKQFPAINGIWYSNNNGQFVRLNMVKQGGDIGPGATFKVAFPNDPRKIYNLDLNLHCSATCVCTNPDGSKQEFIAVSHNSKPEGTIQSLLVSEMDGTYHDFDSGEFIVIKKVASGYECHYSNGKTPYVPMVMSAVDSELGFLFHFPGQPQVKYTCKWLNGDYMARFELKNPNGKKQKYMRVYDSKDARLDKTPNKNEIGGFCKPITYLYPTTPTNVQVKLKTTERLSVTYPEYDSLSGWQVQANPDGTLRTTEGEYFYLFWETEAPPEGHPLPDSGFVIVGKESASFLKEKLSGMGFTPKEYNELIVYWHPILKQSPYVQVHFAYEYLQGGRDYSNPSGKSYCLRAGIDVTPKPETLFRLMMYYSAVAIPRPIPIQKLPKLERKGFTLVEWGGTQGRFGWGCKP